MTKFFKYSEFLNESAEMFGKTFSFREVTSMIKKKFPNVKLKSTSAKKSYYSPKDPSMDIFKLGKYPSRWLDFPCRKLQIDDSADVTLEIAKFLQQNKLKAWTNISKDNKNLWGHPEIYIFDTTSSDEVKKLERKISSDDAKQVKYEVEKIESEKEKKECREKYKTLYDSLKQIPYNMAFKVPEIGDIALMSVNNHQCTWKTWGSFKIYNSDSKQDIESLVKIIDYIFNDSPISKNLTAKKYGI